MLHERPARSPVCRALQAVYDVGSGIARQDQAPVAPGTLRAGDGPSGPPASPASARPLAHAGTCLLWITRSLSHASRLFSSKSARWLTQVLKRADPHHSSLQHLSLPSHPPATLPSLAPCRPPLPRSRTKRTCTGPMAPSDPTPTSADAPPSRQSTNSPSTGATSRPVSSPVSPLPFLLLESSSQLSRSRIFY